MDLGGLWTIGAADVDDFQRCQGYRLDTSPAQATVWLADTVQDHLAGYEFVQWPTTGPRLLVYTLVDDRALWVNPHNRITTAPIGALCTCR